MKKLVAVVLLLSAFSFAGDLHLASRAGKEVAKGAKASGKLVLKGANKLRKQVL